MAREQYRNGLPPQTGYSLREDQKPAANFVAAAPTRSPDVLRTLGSIRRFVPGARPGSIRVDEASLVRPAIVNHVRGMEIIPIFRNDKVARSADNRNVRSPKIENDKRGKGRKSKRTK